MRRVTLLTDFGTEDGYAAAMAGVLASAAPDAVVEHASHAIEQGDLFSAAFTLSRYARLYPEGTVHVVVVDPGVGTTRRSLAARIDGRYYVAPDNGVLTLALQGAQEVTVVEITDPEIVDYASATFHGRDIFAPAAGHLAQGGELEELGPTIYDPKLLPVPNPERSEAGVAGEVIQVDRFGNLITNIPEEWLGRAPSAGSAPSGTPDDSGLMVSVAGEPVGPIRRTYGDVAAGSLVALVGSTGLLEVSVRDGSAAGRLGVESGAPVKVLQGSGPDGHRL